MYTSHGHHIPGTEEDKIPPVADPCGGRMGCRQCVNEIILINPTARVVVTPNASTSSSV